MLIRLLALIAWLRVSWSLMVRPNRPSAGLEALSTDNKMRRVLTLNSGMRLRVSAQSAPPSGSSSKGGVIDLLYDSECPICMMEVNFLQKRDIHGRIRFTDLASPDYEPSAHGNVTFKQGMRKLRAVLPDQTVVTGVEVFRRTYEAIGLGWMFAMTSLPVIGDIADKVYDVWAENRLRLTGREDLAEQLKERSEMLADAEPVDDCDKDGCAIDWEAEGGGEDFEQKSPGSWETNTGGDRPSADRSM